MRELRADVSGVNLNRHELVIHTKGVLNTIHPKFEVLLEDSRSYLYFPVAEIDKIFKDSLTNEGKYDGQDVLDELKNTLLFRQRQCRQTSVNSYSKEVQTYYYLIDALSDIGMEYFKVDNRAVSKLYFASGVNVKDDYFSDTFREAMASSFELVELVHKLIKNRISKEYDDELHNDILNHITAILSQLFLIHHNNLKSSLPSLIMEINSNLKNNK